MQLLVATWTIRVAIIAALAVGGSSYMAGTATIVSVDRGIAAAVLFTFAGRWLMGWLEPPERRLLRMRQKREARRAKSLKAAKAGLAAKSEASGAGGRRKPKSATSAQKA
jgi:hypothetical protein